jgi:hypothetical protein
VLRLLACPYLVFWVFAALEKKLTTNASPVLTFASTFTQKGLSTLQRTSMSRVYANVNATLGSSWYDYGKFVLAATLAIN